MNERKNVFPHPSDVLVDGLHVLRRRREFDVGRGRQRSRINAVVILKLVFNIFELVDDFDGRLGTARMLIGECQLGNQFRSIEGRLILENFFTNIFNEALSQNPAVILWCHQKAQKQYPPGFIWTMGWSFKVVRSRAG